MCQAASQPYIPRRKNDSVVGKLFPVGPVSSRRSFGPEAVWPAEGLAWKPQAGPFIFLELLHRALEDPAHPA
jgi:hypothetical protein